MGEIESVVHIALFQVRQQLAVRRPARVDRRTRIRRTFTIGKVLINIMEVLRRQTHLLEIILALSAGGSFTHLLYGWQEQTDKYSDDGNYHQQFDQRERRTRTSHDGNSSTMENRICSLSREPEASARLRAGLRFAAQRTTSGCCVAQHPTLFQRRRANAYGLSVCCGREKIREEDGEDDRWKSDVVSDASTGYPAPNHRSEGRAEAGEGAGGPIPLSLPIRSKWAPSVPMVDASNAAPCRDTVGKALASLTSVPSASHLGMGPVGARYAWDNRSRRELGWAQTERCSDMPRARRERRNPDIAARRSPNDPPTKKRGHGIR